MPIAPIANGINYVVAGDPTDPPLLFVAGMGMGASGWTLTQNTLNIGQAKKFYMIAYDPRGLYASGDVPDYQFSDMVDDSIALLDYLGIQKAHVLGWSLGGMVAQALAYSYPNRIRRLILLDTTPASLTNPAVIALNDLIRERTGMPLNPQPADFEALMPSLTALSFNNKLLAWLFGLATGLLVKQDVTFYEGLAQQWRAISSATTYEWLGTIKAPTIVLHGDADRLVPLEAQDLIFNALRCTRSKDTIVGGSHGCGIENFLKVNEKIRAWLGG